MTMQTPVGTGHQVTPSPVTEHQARSVSGVTVLVAGVVAVLAGVAVLVYAGQQTGGAKTALVWVGIIVLIIAGLGLAGLTPVVPLARRSSKGEPTSASCAAGQERGSRSPPTRCPGSGPRCAPMPKRRVVLDAGMTPMCSRWDFA